MSVSLMTPIVLGQVITVTVTRNGIPTGLTTTFGPGPLPMFTVQSVASVELFPANSLFDVLATNGAAISPEIAISGTIAIAP